MTYDNTETITVLENGQPISFTFAELLKYHGFGYPAGVARAFKVMQRGFALLDSGKPPERAELSMDTSFPGPGGRDAFEMVTRMVTGDRYNVDSTLVGNEAEKSPNGNHLFRCHYRGRSVDITQRRDFVIPEFVKLTGQASETPEEEERLAQFKKDMAKRFMSHSADDIYNAVVR